MKKFKALILTALALAVFGVVGYATRGDIMALIGSGTLRGIEVFRISSTGDLTLTDSSSYTALTVDSTTGEITTYNGDLALGSKGATISQSQYWSIKVPCYNVGPAVTQGTVMVASNTGVGYCHRVQAAIDVTSVIGVADASIAEGAIGNIVISGYAIVKTTGTISIGDALVSTGTVAGYAGPDTTPTTGAKIGVAVESGGSGDDTVLSIVTLN